MSTAPPLDRSARPGVLRRLYRAIRLPLTILIWVVAIAVVARAVPRMLAQRQVSQVCRDALAGDPEAIDRARAIAGPDEPGLRAAQCAAIALVQARQVDEAVTVLEPWVDHPETAGWLPEPALVEAVAERRRLDGRLSEAVRLVRRATQAYPEDFPLLLRELNLRAQREDPAEVVAEMRQRLPAFGSAAPRFRLELANAYIELGRPDEAAVMLGAPPGDGAPTELVDLWYPLHARTVGLAGDRRAVEETLAEWRRRGGDARIVHAVHAVTLSYFGLEDEQHPLIPMLQQAAADEAHLPENLAYSVHLRLIGHLALAGRTREALALRESVADRFYIAYTPEDILRSGGDLAASGTPSNRPQGRVAFQSPRPGVLRLSPQAGPLDAPFEVTPLDADGRAIVERTPGATPLRWVFVDPNGAPSASGTLWPQSGDTIDVVVRPGSPIEPHPWVPSQAPADGRRRVLALILDSADWRFVRYGLARGELPVLAELIERGYRAELWSEPAFTAMALKALTFPLETKHASFLDVMHQLGSEIEGNNFVRGNPLAFLSWVLPETPSLFDALGAGDRVVINMLNAHGNVQTGRHGEMVGPGGRIGRFEDWRRRRPLTDAETASFAGHASYGPKLAELEELAADFDAAITVAEEGGADLLFLRLAAVDLLHHSEFGEAAEAGQDDGRPLLYGLYRFMDLRLGAVWNALDADDVLVVMSDHGAHSGLEHDPRSVFVAAGGGVPSGRASGQPEIAGVPAFLGALLGHVPEGWPTSVLDAWVGLEATDSGP